METDYKLANWLLPSQCDGWKPALPICPPVPIKLKEAAMTAAINKVYKRLEGQVATKPIGFVESMLSELRLVDEVEAVSYHAEEDVHPSEKGARANGIVQRQYEHAKIGAGPCEHHVDYFTTYTYIGFAAKTLRCKGGDFGVSCQLLREKDHVVAICYIVYKDR